MPITYSYEGAVAAPAYNQSVQAGYGLGLASARRFSAQQQMQANQMAQQAQLSQQQMMNQRYMQQAGADQSMQRINRQGQLNTESQVRANDFRIEERDDLAAKRMEYDKYIRSADLDDIGKRGRAVYESGLQRISEAVDSGAINPAQAEEAELTLLGKALGSPVRRQVRTPDGEKVFLNPDTMHMYRPEEDGSITDLGPQMPTIEQMKERGHIVDEELADGTVLRTTVNRSGAPDTEILGKPYQRLLMEAEVAKINYAARAQAQKEFAAHHKARSDMAELTDDVGEPMYSRQQIDAMFPSYPLEHFTNMQTMVTMPADPNAPPVPQGNAPGSWGGDPNDLLVPGQEAPPAAEKTRFDRMKDLMDRRNKLSGKDVALNEQYMPRPRSQAEFDALPSGTLFKDPNGVTRQKP